MLEYRGNGAKRNISSCRIGLRPLETLNMVLGPHILPRDSIPDSYLVIGYNLSPLTIKKLTQNS